MQTPKQPSNGIGILREKSLHAQIKEWYRKSGDRVEVSVEGYVVDLVRGDQLIEIQTGNFSAIKKKYETLLQKYRIRLVYPIIRRKIIKTFDTNGELISIRTSPKKGRSEDVFDELIRIPGLLVSPNLDLELIHVEVDEVRRRDGKGSWRRKGVSIVDRELLSVLKSEILGSASDFSRIIPPDLPEPFSNRDLSAAIPLNVRKVRKITYTLARIGCLEVSEKRGNELLYCRI